MKQMITILAATLLSASVFAQDTFDGCGLGWEVTQDKTVIATTTRGTTNAFVPPSFGMTTGSLGCDEFTGIAMNDRSSAEYVAKNFETIRAELATGQGEYVDATAQSFNCDSQAFGKHMQKNYDGVVAPSANGIELYNNLKAEAAKVCS